MKTDDLTPKQVKATIKCIHRLWYGESWTESPTKALELHRHMEVLFNYADITSTLVENNPNEISPDDFKKMTGAKDLKD